MTLTQLANKPDKRDRFNYRAGGRTTPHPPTHTQVSEGVSGKSPSVSVPLTHSEAGRSAIGHSPFYILLQIYHALFDLPAIHYVDHEGCHVLYCPRCARSVCTCPPLGRRLCSRKSGFLRHLRCMLVGLVVHWCKITSVIYSRPTCTSISEVLSVRAPSYPSLLSHPSWPRLIPCSVSTVCPDAAHKIHPITKEKVRHPFLFAQIELLVFTLPLCPFERRPSP
jgi:hypothetical protein